MAEDLAFTLERLADETRPVRLTNLSALSDLPRSQALVFRAAWAYFSPERRFELILELVEQAETNIHFDFHAVLYEVLQDEDARIRRLAVDGLWEDNRPMLVGPLARLARANPAPEVRAAAAMALGRFILLGVQGEIPEERSAQAEESLWSVWRNPREEIEVRRRALEGLAYTNQPNVRELILTAYDDEDPLLRQSAVFAMGHSAERRWSRYVLSELDGRDAAMRFEAATAAGELALSDAVRPLIRLLDDADSSVREAAAAALGQIGGPAAKRALEDAASSPLESLALAAEAALEELQFNSGNADEVAFDFVDLLATPAAAALEGLEDFDGDGHEDDMDVDSDAVDVEDELAADDGFEAFDADELDWLDEDDPTEADDDGDDW